MTQKSMMYDNAAYQAILPIPLFGTATGSNLGMLGASLGSSKFAAFTAMIVKSVTLVASTVGTSSVASNTVIAYRITNNGTTAVNTCTGTYTLAVTGVPGANGVAVTTAAYVVNGVPPAAVSGTSAASANPWISTTPAGIPLLQGDIFYITKGTDATEVVAVTVEAVLQPNASITL